MKKALITGVTGQDGSLLAKFLLKKNYIVHGLIRRSSSFNTSRIEDIYSYNKNKKSNFHLHYGDMVDSSNLFNLVNKIKPDEIYNLAAQSHVKVSFELPEYTANVDALGCLRLLEAIRQFKLEKKTKFYQASTSEMFGSTAPPQNENTVFAPASPYGAAKLYAHWITKNYRVSYKIFACSGILFNHEGPYRGGTFVTKKIIDAAIDISRNNKNILILGNLDAKRDWGDADEYVDGMWRIMQHSKPDDFVLATGRSYSVRYFVEKVFKKLDMPIKWVGKGIKEKGICIKTKKTIIKIDKSYFRPQEVSFLLGDAKKASKVLKWKASSSIDSLIQKMIDFKINKL
jgi:GDPmannose 4,6-dehydratase